MWPAGALSEAITSQVRMPGLPSSTRKLGSWSSGTTRSMGSLLIVPPGCVRVECSAAPAFPVSGGLLSRSAPPTQAVFPLMRNYSASTIYVVQGPQVLRRDHTKGAIFHLFGTI